jgi:hypothetical protein
MFDGVPAGRRYGIMICGHDSRNHDAVGQFARLAERMRERFNDICCHVETSRRGVMEAAVNALAGRLAT